MFLLNCLYFIRLLKNEKRLNITKILLLLPPTGNLQYVDPLVIVISIFRLFLVHL